MRIERTPVAAVARDWGTPDPATVQAGVFGTAPPTGLPLPAPAPADPARPLPVMTTADGVPFVLPEAGMVAPPAARPVAPLAAPAPSAAAPALTSFVPQAQGLVEAPFVADEVAQRDPRFIDISGLLPSNLGFYAWNSASIRPFGLNQVRLMNRAVAESSIIHQLNAISSVLTRSAYDLTLGDLQWVMYWLRLNSYKRSPVVVKWTCDNPRHLASVGNKEVDPATLNQITHVTSLEGVAVKPLDFQAVNAAMIDFYRTYQLYLFVPCARDLVEGMAEGLTADDDWWNKYAGLLNPQHHGQTLAARRAFLMAMADSDPDMLVAMENFAELQTHGPVETVTGVCSHCNATSTRILRIDPLSFLPQNQVA